MALGSIPAKCGKLRWSTRVGGKTAGCHRTKQAAVLAAKRRINRTKTKRKLVTIAYYGAVKFNCTPNTVRPGGISCTPRR